MRSYILLPCESVHLVRKNGVWIQDLSPALGPRRLGGLPPFEKSGLRKIFFSWAGMVAAARIGWVGVAVLSLRIAEVSVGISQCQILDCRVCLSVGSVGWQVSAKEKAREFRLRGPCLHWCHFWCQ